MQKIDLFRITTDCINCHLAYKFIYTCTKNVISLMCLHVHIFRCVREKNACIVMKCTCIKSIIMYDNFNNLFKTQSSQGSTWSEEGRSEISLDDVNHALFLLSRNTMSPLKHKTRSSMAELHPSSIEKKSHICCFSLIRQYRYMNRELNSFN